MLIARTINAYFGTAYTGDDLAAMPESDLLEMLVWIENQ